MVCSSLFLNPTYQTTPLNVGPTLLVCTSNSNWAEWHLKGCLWNHQYKRPWNEEKMWSKSHDISDVLHLSSKILAFFFRHSLRRGVWCCRVGRSDFEVGRSVELILFWALNDRELKSVGNPLLRLQGKAMRRDEEDRREWLDAKKCKDLVKS